MAFHLEYYGVFTKMLTYLDDKVQYYLPLSNAVLHINELLDRKISISHTGYHCLNCQKEKKIFRQGFCYDCFISIPAAGDWIMKPELSKAHLDIEDRNLAYEKEVQLQPHLVYFAIASDLKVGVTRKSQIPTRWIDQGASVAFPIVEVPNRYLAGITEVALKQYYTDKTNWKKMLQNQQVEFHQDIVLQEVVNYLPAEILPFFENTLHSAMHIHYPVLQYPNVINNLSLEKSVSFSGVLKGIKGQYLIFEDGTVFNVRSHEGYKVSLRIDW